MKFEHKIIKGKAHVLYPSSETFYNEHPYLEDVKLKHWRSGDTNQWVLTDDDCVVQVLKRGNVKNPDGKKDWFVRTICGTYLLKGKKEMYGQIAENIYTFSGTNEYQRQLKKKNGTSKEIIFAQYIATGDKPVDAYLKTYETDNPKYAKNRALRLLRTNRIQEMVKEEIKAVLEEEGVSPNYIVSRLKQVADIGERDSDVLRSLDVLAKISGLYDTQTNDQQQLTVWSGFTPEQLKSIKDQQLLVSENSEDA